MHPRFSHYEEVKTYLYSLKHHGAKYGIERMELLADLIGHPEHEFPLIHVAGTNGKGSTCAMLEAIYRHAGFKTGLFTSPHLVFQGERIQVNRQPLDRNAIVAYAEQLRKAALTLAKVNSNNHPSFFEFMTAMAFLRFAREKVDIGIIETGLGGRLDATNIVRPELSIITSISFDHCELLGHTLAQIAYEKAGIIKEGKPVVLGRLLPEAEETIRTIARERKAPVYAIREHFDGKLTSYPATNLQGQYQCWNAATATLVVRLLRVPRSGEGHQRIFPVTDAQIDTALGTVDWPGRWELRKVDGKILMLDTSHNPEGAEMLAQNLEQLVEKTSRKPIIMVGTLGPFRANSLMSIVARYAREILLLKPSQPRAATFDMLRTAIPSHYSGRVRPTTVKDLFPFPSHCSEGEAGDILVATGSIYLIGEIIEALDYPLAIREHTLQDVP